MSCRQVAVGHGGDLIGCGAQFPQRDLGLGGPQPDLGARTGCLHEKALNKICQHSLGVLPVLPGFRNGQQVPDPGS